MFSNFINESVALFLSFGENYGYLAIFIGALADSLIPIVPSEIVFGAGGFWAYKGYISLLIAVAIAVVGNLLASALFWYLGKKYGHGFLLKWGKFIGFKSTDMDKAEKIFEKWGYWSVFVCQFIPLFRSLISIPSGVLELHFKKFMIATGAGALVWNAVLMLLAYNLGENWSQIGGIITKFGKPLFYIAVLFVIILIVKIVYDRNFKQKLDSK